MIEITVKVPKDVRDIITGAGETIYIEALNQVAFKRISYFQKQLEAFEKEIRIFKDKYNKSFEDFLQDVPDTIEGHDDWIEWTYLVKAADELSKKIEKLSLLERPVMANRFYETVNAFSDMVKAIEDLEIVQKETVSKLKAKLRLFDGSILWVREVYIYDLMEVYSYYWLRPDETMIIGWDNAPHHRDVKTYPHHRHFANKVENSDQRSLEDILNFIKSFFE